MGRLEGGRVLVVQFSRARIDYRRGARLYRRGYESMREERVEGEMNREFED